MVDLDESIIARYESHGKTFEILIDKKVAKLVREDEEVDLIEHMVIDEIFEDSKRGDRASEGDLRRVFGTTEVTEVAKTIILKGEVQLTTEQRREMREIKRKKVIGTIARNAINPQTRTPHPPSRIENAMNEARVNIDPLKPAEVQVKDVVDAIRHLIPLSFESVKLAIKLAGTDYGRCYGDISEVATLQNEEWQNDGSWIGVVELPAGMRQDLEEILNSKTKGNVEIKSVE